MQVEQLAVFLENRSGRLAEVTSTLAENNIDIRALSVADTADFGILRLIVDKVEQARDALKKNGFSVVQKTGVAAVAVPDSVGGLAGVMKAVSRGGYNVEYMYACVRSTGDHAIMIFKFDDMDGAVKALEKNGFALVSGQQICAA